MYTVTNDKLQIVRTFAFLSEAKNFASHLSIWYRKIYFVCDAQGLVIAGY